MIIIWIELLTGTVLVNKVLLARTVPVNKLLLVGTVLVNKLLLAGTVPVNKFSSPRLELYVFLNQEDQENGNR